MRKLSITKLSDNAIKTRKFLSSMQGNIIEAKQLHKLVMSNLNCSLRTAQRVTTELYNSQQITAPVVYKITTNN